MTQKWLVLIAVACGTFMATLDSSIVNIALPTLTKDLNTSLDQVKWVVITYLWVITCLLLPFGRLSDQYGRKSIFQFGFLVFVCGSALCGFSPNLSWLLVSRVIQGVGASMLMSNGPAIITTAFPASERGKALGIMAMVVSLGLVTGPSVGGLLIGELGWRSIFLINVPIGIAGVVFVQRFVPWNRGSRSSAPFDWAGALVQMLLLISFLVVMDPPLLSVSGSHIFRTSRLLAIGMFLVFLALFIKLESEAEAPIFDTTLLRDKTFRHSNLAGLLTFIAFSSLTVMMPFFLEEVMHFSPKRAGAFMTAIPLTIFVVAPFSGRLSDKLGTWIISSAGATVAALGYFSMAGVFGNGLHEKIPHPIIVLALCSIGLAVGMFQSPNNSAIMSSVPAHKLGVASALLATVRNLGLATGTGLATKLFGWRMNVTGDFVTSFHFVLFMGGLIAVGAMILSLTRKRASPHQHSNHYKPQKPKAHGLET